MEINPTIREQKKSFGEKKGKLSSGKRNRRGRVKMPSGGPITKKLLIHTEALPIWQYVSGKKTKVRRAKA